MLNGLPSQMEYHVVFPPDKADEEVMNAPNHIVVGILISEEEAISSWIDACVSKSV